MEKIGNLDILIVLKKIKNNINLFIFNIIFIPLFILVIAFVIPEKFTSTGLILPPEEQFDPLLYGFSGIGEGVSSGLTKLMGGNSVSELWVTILRSRIVMLTVVDELNLIDKWGSETYEEAYQAIKGIVSIIITPEGVIILNVTTEDPFLSKDIAEELIINLDKMNQKLLHSVARDRRIFIENRIISIKDSMVSIENSIVKFSTNYKLMDIEIESKPMIQVLSNLKAQEILLESELSALSIEQTIYHPQRRSVEARLGSIKEKINQIEYEGGNGIGLGFSVPLESLPSLGMEYAKLQMDYLVQTEVFKLLVQEYERAKIAEQKDTPTLKVVDWPQVPEKKSYPKRSLFLAVGIFLGFSIGIISILLKDKFEEELKDNEVRKKWESLIYDW